MLNLLTGKIFYFMEGLLKKSPATVFAGYSFYEYLLVVHPQENVYQQLMEEKQNFFYKYKEKVAIKTKPHITIANFLAKEEMEDTIIRYMHRIISMQHSFTATLNNYSGFPSHTVYARVQDHQPFTQLAASLKVIDQYIRVNGCPQARLIMHPHISIARRLQPGVYEKAVFEYSQKTFHASFQVTELILLKRKNQFDACRQLMIFKLLPH